VRGVCAAPTAGSHQDDVEALCQLWVAGGLCEDGETPLEAVRERPLPPQGERLLDAKFATKGWQGLFNQIVGALKRVKDAENAGRPVRGEFGS
jgi:hypothetical protein